MASAPTTKSVTRTYKSLVLKQNPNFEAEKRREVEYEFSRRKFSANRAVRHPYNIEDEED